MDCNDVRSFNSIAELFLSIQSSMAKTIVGRQPLANMGNLSNTKFYEFLLLK